MQNQVSFTGKAVAEAQAFQSETFRKRSFVFECSNQQGYISYLQVDFIQDKVDTLAPTIQLGAMYSVTAWLQGSKVVNTDKQNFPTAYMNLQVASITQAQGQAAPQQQGYGAQPQYQQPQQQYQQNNYAQQNQYQQPQQTGAPQFGPPPQQQYQQNNQAQQQAPQFGPPPQQQQPHFGPPAQQQAPAQGQQQGGYVGAPNTNDIPENAPF